MNPRVRELEDRARIEAVPARRVDLLNDLAWELRHLDGRRALALGLEATNLAVLTSYPKGEAYGLRNQAYSRSLLSENKESLDLCEQALRIFEQLRDEFGQASVLNIIGNVQHSVGDYGKSLESHYKSLALKLKIGDNRGASYSWNNLGTVYDRLDDRAKALECYFKSLKIKLEIGDREGVAGTLNNVGFEYEKMREHESALDYYSRSLECARETGDRQSESTALMNIGNVYCTLGKYEEALKNQEQCLGMKREMGDREGEATALVNLGETFMRSGNWARASECLMECMRISREIGNRYLETETMNDLGDLSLRENDGEKAVECFERAVTLAEEIGSKSCLARSYKALSEIFEGRADIVRALQYFKAFHQTNADIFNEEADRKARGLIIQFEVETAQKEKEIYRLRNIELAQANEEKTRLVEQLRQQALILERTAREDGLTGVYNRRFLDELLLQEFLRARRFKHPLTVVIADIDHFKSINDRFSHQAGDLVIRTVADIFRKTCRVIDIVGRYGGEEFVMLLPETTREKAFVICEKIRLAVEQYDWSAIHPDIRVTVSMGVSDDLSCANSEKMISAADTKLYEAKNAGRNRVL